MVFQSIATPSAELEYVSDRDVGFKQLLEKCKLLTRRAFEYFDQTADLAFFPGDNYRYCRWLDGISLFRKNR